MIKLPEVKAPENVEQNIQEGEKIDMKLEQPGAEEKNNVEGGPANANEDQNAPPVIKPDASNQAMNDPDGKQNAPQEAVNAVAPLDENANVVGANPDEALKARQERPVVPRDSKILRAIAPQPLAGQVNVENAADESKV